MIYTDFKDFPRTGRLVGIDWGARRMGVAVSTPEQTFVFAHPQLTINNEQLTIDTLLKIISDEKIAGIIIGLPLHADGADSDTTKRVREFADKLSAKTYLPIAFIEENLTSVAAIERQKAEGRRQKDIDSESAKIILENAIAMIKRAKGQG